MPTKKKSPTLTQAEHEAIVSNRLATMESNLSYLEDLLKGKGAHPQLIWRPAPWRSRRSCRERCERGFAGPDSASPTGC